ncbi:hypothetical protein LCGC14_0979460 [marine sediment metagenome]|uniref:Uncharacterized protein n=1 Tax=marine sediment metagenome TaxID=412755 RepID=A0A0F9QSK7_9ZZZZ
MGGAGRARRVGTVTGPVPLLDQDLVDIIEDDGEDLNSWEVNFISDMVDRLSEGKPLSDGQRKKAEQIYEQRVS